MIGGSYAVGDVPWHQTNDPCSVVVVRSASGGREVQGVASVYFGDRRCRRFGNTL
jgi:hypothetical protein